MANGEGETKGPSAPETPAATAAASSNVHLERFARVFETSARRWELVVYPSLFAFIVLAAYGFFLVYSLTRDMRLLSTNVDPEMHRHMSTMTASIQHLADTISTMNGTIEGMAASMKSIDSNMLAMKGDTGQMAGSTGAMQGEMDLMEQHMTTIAIKLNALDPIVINMAAMNEAMKAMTLNTGLLSRDIGRPMNFMNQFAPW